MKKNIIAIPLLSLLLIVSSRANVSINNVFIDNFYTTEQFFLKHSCSFLFPAIFVYDTKSEVWYSKLETIEAFPQLSEEFAGLMKRDASGKMTPCTIVESRESLAIFLGVRPFQDDEKIGLFFAAPFTDSGKHMFEILGYPKGLETEKRMLDIFEGMPLKTKVIVNTPVRKPK